MSYENAAKLLRLAICAAGRVGVTLSDIEAMFECDRRTAQRMTVKLTELFPDTDRWVDADDQRPRWRLPAASVTPFMTPSPEELAVLARAIDKLSNDGAANEARILKGLEERVLATIPRSARARIEVDEEALLQALGLAARPGPRPLSNETVDHILGTALKGRLAIEILYRGVRDQDARWRLVAPHGLLLGTRRYLVACDMIRGDRVPRHYRVDDILDARLKTETFDPIPDFDIGAHARHGFSSYVNNDEIEDVVWQFAPEAASRARSFSFHPDQEVEFLADGSLVVRFRACGLLEMAWHLYAWGDKVDVLAPEGLRRMVADHRRADFDALP
jgi:predicted DNA-binding transcriptional regulator YafY